jgi:DNA modification methylase
MDKTTKTETANSMNAIEKLLKVKRKLAIEYRSIAALRIDPKNPRLHSEKQIRQIAKSIQVFGFNAPILINAEMQVVAGHGRLQACKLLGLTEAPTIRLEHLTEAQARAFMIADNRLNETSAWDDRLLAEQLQALSVHNLDFSVAVTGFEMGEINMMIEGLAPPSRGKDNPADAIPDSGAKSQVTRVGDLWVMGCHRVYCGDGRNEAAYSGLMQGRRGEMVFTDPPYNHSIDRCVTGFGKIHRPEFLMVSGEMSDPKFINSLKSVLVQSASNSIDGALHFICADWRHSGELIGAARSVYAEFKDLCVWVKDKGTQGSLYRSQHEFVFVFKSGKPPHGNNTQQDQVGRCRTNVWRYRGVNSLSRNSQKGRLAAPYGTIKPVELVADAILDATARGDMVLDPFLGSGTTLIAAERTGRVCHGIELDPRYVDTIVRRWQTFTGQNAVQESTGRTFNQIEEENRGRAE